MRVVQMRGGSKISLGDGGQAPMLRRIRGHANFAEYVPLALVLMAVLELSHLSPLLLHALGVTLLAARLLHGIALSFSEQFFLGRFWGTLLTFVVVLAGAVLCVLQGLGLPLP
jgi:uncharacterized membrane protein YecN with MAPEG domain